MAAQPAARPALQHRGNEGEGLSLRHRTGGHSAVVRVELPPPPGTRAIRPLSRDPSSPSGDPLFEAEQANAGRQMPSAPVRRHRPFTMLLFCSRSDAPGKAWMPPLSRTARAETRREESLSAHTKPSQKDELQCETQGRRPTT